ncbi:hypothetical protein ACWKT5_00150 [Streptomyces avermitilis]
MCTSHGRTEAERAGVGRRGFPGATALIGAAATAVTLPARPLVTRGGYPYAGKTDQILHGRLGDVRIAERALPVTSFRNHRPEGATRP